MGKGGKPVPAPVLTGPIVNPAPAGFFFASTVQNSAVISPALSPATPHPNPLPGGAREFLGEARLTLSHAVPAAAGAKVNPARALPTLRAAVLPSPGAVERPSADEAYRLGRRTFELDASGSAVDVPSGPWLSAVEPSAPARPPSSGREGGASLAPSSGPSIPQRTWLRDQVSYWRAVSHEWLYYSFTRVSGLWRKYSAKVEALPAEERAVYNPRLFLADLRLMGTSGRFYALGFEALPDDEMIAEARVIFKRHFRADEAAKDAFERMVDRSTGYNPLRRASNLRKSLRDALMDASMLPRSELAAHFDAQLTPAQKAVREAFSKDGLAATLEAFESAARRTILEEAPGESRVVGVVLLGSFPSGAAGPASDFDFQVITADGGAERIASFAKRLEHRWEAEGHTQELTAHAYAMPVSRDVIARIHWEPFLVISPYREVVSRMLLNGGPLFKTVRRWEWWSPLVVGAYKALTIAVTLASDAPGLLSRIRRPGPPMSVDQVLTGLYATRTVSIVFTLLTAIATPTLVRGIVGGAAFASAWSWMSALGFAAAMPAIALNGSLVDKLGARRAMTAGALGRAGTLLAIWALAAAGRLTYGAIVPLSIAHGALMSVTLVGEKAIIPQLLKDQPERLQRTNATLELTFSATAALGAALAGSVVKSIGAANVFLWYGLLNVVFVAPMYLIHLPPRTAPYKGGWLELTGKVLGGLRTSAGIVLRDVAMRRALFFFAAFGALSMPLRSTIVQVLNNATAGGDPVTLGWLFASLYVGMTLGNIATILHEKLLGRTWMLRAGAVGLASFGLLLLPGLGPALAGLFLLGLLTASANVVLPSMFQERVQASHPGGNGRLMGIHGGMFSLAAFAGNLALHALFSNLPFAQAMRLTAAAFGLGAILLAIAPTALGTEDPRPESRKD